MAGMTYDERQVAVRGRIAGWMMVVTVAAIFVNGWVVDEWKVWGTGLQQAFAIVWPVSAISMVWVVWSRAYFARGQQPRWMLLVFGILLAIFSVVLVRERAQIWVDGRAGEAWSPLMMSLFLAAAFVSIAARELVDRRSVADPD